MNGRVSTTNPVDDFRFALSIRTEKTPDIRKINRIRGLSWFTSHGLLLEIIRIVGGRYYGISERGEIQTIVLTEAMTTSPTRVTTH